MTGDVIRIVALCLVATAVCIILKQKNAEYALLVSVAAGAAVILLVLKNISAPIESVKYKLSQYGIEEEYFKVALKSLGIGYITTFIADACRDSGQTSLASKAELAGKSAIFLLSLPLIFSVLETAVGFIQ